MYNPGAKKSIIHMVFWCIIVFRWWQRGLKAATTIMFVEGAKTTMYTERDAKGAQMYLGVYIASKLDEHNWTIQELVERTGMPRSTIANLMHTQRVPMLETISKLAQALDVPTAEIIEACGFSIRPEKTSQAEAERIGRVVHSIPSLRELFLVLSGAKPDQIEQVLAYVEGVTGNRRNRRNGSSGPDNN